MCITAEAEVALKPFQLANLLRSELELVIDDNDNDNNHGGEIKPKDIVALAWAKLGENNGSLTTDNVKDNARAARAMVRSLKANFWTDIKARNGTEMKDLLHRLLAKPTSAGGFAAGIACTCFGAKNIDTKNIHAQGISSIDGFTVLRGPGAYITLDHEMEMLYKLFKSSHVDVCKIGDTTFRVEERTQPYKGQDLLTAKATKCDARFVALLTPRWLLVGLYQYVVNSNETNAAILQLFEDLRLEVIAPK